MGKKRASLHSLGCKVNAYELEAVAELLAGAGYEIVPFGEAADVTVINTCTVTNMADRKSRQLLHRARKLNPEGIVVAMGCYVQTDREGALTDPSIDLVLGNNHKIDILSALASLEKAGEEGPDRKIRASRISEIASERDYEPLFIERDAERVRAFLKIQDGCNQFCSYCAIPLARGRVRSRKKEEILSEVSRLGKAGYQEIVLTGIHLSSYASDFRMESGEALLSLIEDCQKVPGIMRIRLGSLEPRIISEDFARSLASLEKVCPHFHLSLQSGCDETLKRMNRRYTSGEYFEKCEILRSYFDRPALTTDVIVGFPGETREEFERSAAFIDRVGFYQTHIFKYSRRAGTRAAGMEGQVPEEEKSARSECLLTLREKNERAYEDSLMGRTVPLLLEEEVEIGGERCLVGHSPSYVRAAVEAKGRAVNEIVPVRLCGRKKPHLLLGEEVLISGK